MEAPDARKPLICLGEGLVDLIRPDPESNPGDGAGDLETFETLEVHCGGALANVAVAASRAGAPVALASGCGTDRWGSFLVERLREEGIDLRFYTELEDAPTAFAFAFLDSGGEPTFEIHGEGIDASIATLAGREQEIVDEAGAIAFGSNTLVAERSRTITAEIVRRAEESGVPLLFDPNLRPGRWDDLDLARSVCLPYAERADVLKCNAGEAAWLLGDPGAGVEDAAEALRGHGPELVVVTDGTRPAVARGAITASVLPPPVEVVSPLGAGDAFMGTLAAGLHATGFDLGRAEEALERATEAAAQACTHLGAFER